MYIAPVAASYPPGVRISIVVPTRDRPELLRECLEALSQQDIEEPFEVIVVDDSPVPVELPAVAGLHSRTVASGGRGPAAARNAGIAAASGVIVLFTDDDTRPDRRWVRSAVAHLDAHPLDVGVEGPTWSPPFDHLYEHSVHSAGYHALLTCNIAYRRSTLRELGAFYEGFPHPHCEDLDFGFRALSLGPLGRCEHMVVVHPPRPVPASAIIKRGRLILSELELMRRHPERYLSNGRSPTAVAARGWVMRWVRTACHERRQLVASPRRAARFAYVATGQLALAAITLARASVSNGSGRRAP